MGKRAYLDCPTGIAGDMCLGALLHAGVPQEYLLQQLNRLGLAEDYSVRVETVIRGGQHATKVHVDLVAGIIPAAGDPDPNPTFGTHEMHPIPHPHHSHPSPPPALEPSEDSSTTTPPSLSRHLPDIEQRIRAALLPKRAEMWSLAVFRRLAEAEAAVHGIAPEEVHFHEVGATDAIVDIVGTCLGLDWLNIDALYCSPLPTGGGTVRAAHGRMPVPTPAVLRLFEMAQVPVFHNGIDRELVTPTGAAIATTLAKGFGPPPSMTIQRVGLGAGSMDLVLPNILRLWVGDAHNGWEENPKRAIAQTSNGETLETSETLEAIAVLETQVDDLSPQAIGYVLDALLDAGALDVFTQAVGMKKSRPGILITVLCRPEIISLCEHLLFRETTTLGIRRQLQQRHILQRTIHTVQTQWGAVRIKVSWMGSASLPEVTSDLTTVHPEYEDCAQLARLHNLPWRQIHQQALLTWAEEQAKPLSKPDSLSKTD